MKLLIEVTSNVIGINLWLAPQISEHCPKNKPGRFDNDDNWLSRPGTASIFKPCEGTVQEWITSAEVIIYLIFMLKGITRRLSTSNKRKELRDMSEDGIIKESKSILKSEYS